MKAITTYGPAIDVDELLREIALYLAAVDEFRQAGHEPRWRREEDRS